ncbi:MAG TPA: YjbE family putative metal transport protein [Ktedonobacterales bacterium]|jgi:YjbE family integral membrane protein|nr:YjbE family putative metal transport protein [Ktedonobacterales bacterium]
MSLSWLANSAVRWLLTLGSIILVDIALSGDNALVIGAAASRLTRSQRARALLWGGLGAAVLRITLTGVATELLLVPLLQTAGALVILVIAIRMLTPEQDDDRSPRRASDRLFPAILSILAADVTMSVDNVLAIGALARGNLPLLVIGLLISVALLLVASALVAQIISRFGWLIDLTALILGYLAAQLVTQDPIVSRFADLTGVRAIALKLGMVTLVGVVALWRRLFTHARQQRSEALALVVMAGEESAVSDESTEADHAAW